ncbi:MAG: rhomboid family intramembrane serine protease [Thermoanaerobaculia bacterium]
MIPLRHTLPQISTPIVNRTLVATNIAVFIVQIFMGPNAEHLIETLGFMPARFLHPAIFGFAAWETTFTLFTSLFLHGGFVHLAGNMIYLWVFGGPVEDAFGHLRYFFFFVACGAIGSLAHTLVFPTSTIPSIGASGSIAGILGAFLVLRPHAHIVTLFPLVVYWAMAEIRAAFFLPVWFLMQFFNGFASLASAKGTEEVAGVAWWAHVGGFLFGAIVAGAVRLLMKRKEHA